MLRLPAQGLNSPGFGEQLELQEGPHLCLVPELVRLRDAWCPLPTSLQLCLCLVLVLGRVLCCQKAEISPRGSCNLARSGNPSPRGSGVSARAVLGGGLWPALLWGLSLGVGDTVPQTFSIAALPQGGGNAAGLSSWEIPGVTASITCVLGLPSGGR